MNRDYVSLKHLQESEGYKVLEQLWVYQVSDIEKARDKAAQRGTETAWRYWAGQEAGFKLAMTAVVRALLEMEKDDANTATSINVDKLLEEFKNK